MNPGQEGKRTTVSRRPNILLIMTDQQSANMMSCTGTSWVDTPALDTLASEGTRFQQAICANPVCVPSRMSMATGIMSCRIAAPDNGIGMKAVFPDAVADNSLGLLMQRAGYDTFYGGKVHMCPQLAPLQAGYDVYHKNERDMLADACVEFITEERDQPFFAVASFINPHDICYVHNAKVGRDPRMPTVTALYEQADQLPDAALPPLPDNFAVPDSEPPGLHGRCNTTAITPSGTMYLTYTERDWRIYRWVYARLTEQVDHEIGRILDVLKANGLEDDTVVIFTSDHGNMHANHGLASKGVFYEESVRVPFIVKHRGVIPAGRVDAQHLVNTGLDILPTCCDYAGCDVPAGLLGISQRMPAQADADAASHDYVVSENGIGRMLRTQRWKYTIYAGNAPREILTDLAADPGEMRNQANDSACADVLSRCRNTLRGWFEQSGDAEGLRNYVADAT